MALQKVLVTLDDLQRELDERELALRIEDNGDSLEGPFWVAWLWQPQALEAGIVSCASHVSLATAIMGALNVADVESGEEEQFVVLSDRLPPNDNSRER
jgi:hypothetical protein